MASGVPIPAPLGSPAGPNLYQTTFLATIIDFMLRRRNELIRLYQWFCGAPVVLARKPAYVVPFTVFPITSCNVQSYYNRSSIVGLGNTLLIGILRTESSNSPVEKEGHLKQPLLLDEHASAQEHPTQLTVDRSYIQ